VFATPVPGEAAQVPTQPPGGRRSGVVELVATTPEPTRVTSTAPKTSNRRMPITVAFWHHPRQPLFR
jgi:hypothetical protein